jgi:hypothetical protein
MLANPRWIQRPHYLGPTEYSLEARGPIQLCATLLDTESSTGWTQQWLARNVRDPK